MTRSAASLRSESRWTPKVLGRRARVEPLVRTIVRYYEPIGDHYGQTVSDVIQQLIEDRGLSPDCVRGPAPTARCLAGDCLTEREL